ncbi:MAG: hypothetical protein SFU83_23990 [Meiothermus sp.]|nr:hypothetical protein [Meiothermus sp.]
MSTGTLGLTLEISPPVPGFNPSVEVRRGGSLIRTVTNLGRTELARLEAGTYTISAGSLPTNYKAALTVGTDNVTNAQVEVKAGQTLEARLSFAQGFGSLRVSVTPPAGVSGFTPTVRVRNSTGATVATLTQTDTIDNLPLGTYTVETPNVSAMGVPWAASTSGSPANVTLSTVPEIGVSYAATRSAITVNLTGLGATDPASVTLSRSDGTGTPATQNRTGNGPVVFGDLPFGGYLVRASSNRAGTYIDSTVGFVSSSPTVTASTDLSTVFRTLEAPMTARPQTGRLFVAGNGSMSNTGWTVGRLNTRPSTATPPAATPEPNPCLTTGGVGTCPVVGTDTSIDSGFSLADGEVPGSSSNLPASSSLTDAGELSPAGLYRIEFDPSGNLYAIYQFALAYSSTLPPTVLPPPPLSGNRIVRVTRQNLEASPPVLTEGGSNRVMFNDSIGNGARGSNVTDIAFDAQGNLWMANQAGDAISCVSASQLNAAGAFGLPDKVIVGSTAVTPYHLQNPRAIAFDAQGDLWVAGGRHAPQLTSAGTNLEPYLARISDDATLACSGGQVTVAPDIYLNISLTTSTSGAFFQPWGMAIQTAGGQQALWITDYGGGVDVYNSTTIPASSPTRWVQCPGDGRTAQSNDGSMDGNITRESVIKVPLSGANLTVSSALRTAVVTSRLTVGAADDPTTTSTDRDRGLQQATHLAFDSRGNLWVAANNHTEFDPANPCFSTSGFDVLNFGAGPLSRLRTDRRGKLYVIGAGELGDRGSTALTHTPITPLLTLSSPTAGVGFSGIAFR